MTQDDKLLDEIRAALRVRMIETSLRTAAREVGMSPAGLQQMVGGAHPYQKTWCRLVAWYTAQQSTPPPLDDAMRRTVLISLTRHLPRARREAAMSEITHILQAAAG